MIKFKEIFPIITDKDFFLNLIVRNESEDMKKRLWDAVCNHERKGIYQDYALVGDHFVYNARGNGQWTANPYKPKM